MSQASADTLQLEIQRIQITLYTKQFKESQPVRVMRLDLQINYQTFKLHKQ